MNKEPINYSFWDDKNLVSSFNKKSASSFFDSEKRLLEETTPNNLKTVLDIGCSCGRFIELLNSLGFRGKFSGIDISSPSIEICQKNYPMHQFKVKNALDLDTNTKYSLVNATGVIQHEKNYQILIQKMLSLSSEYILFDLKMSNTSQPIVDINRCYCRVSTEKIHMITFNYHHLIDTLKNSKGVGDVIIYGYETPPNKQTTRPDSIKRWASCGVLIKKGRNFNLSRVTLPEFIDLD